MPNFTYFVRTAEGQAAAYDATSAMPRKLKSLLKVIDGKTSLAVFANSLKAFGDVKGLLSSLQHAGLIEMREVSEPSQAPAQTITQTTTTEPTTGSTTTPPTTGFVTTLASKIGLRPSSSEQADGFALTQAAYTQSPTILLEQSAISAQAQQERRQDLQLLVQDMSSFVLAYVPEQAFSVLSELEQITTVEQTAVLLGGYELMVRHAGEPAKIHLMHVRKMLGKWL